MKFRAFILIVFLLPLASDAQFQVRDSALFAPHVTISFGYQTPGGDMANRFANNMSIGLGFHLKTKTSWYYGVHGNFLFGNRVNEPGFLQNLRTEQNEILDDQGQVAVVIPQERGFSVSIDGGRLFNILGPNKNSGVLLVVGAGFLQHKIRIEHQENEITQLSGDYLKGYDRLTNGFAAHQFAGYFHMSNNGLINFKIGLEAYQGFTKSRRDFNFDTKKADSDPRFDALVGIRVGWILHFYERTPVIQYFD